MACGVRVGSSVHRKLVLHHDSVARRWGVGVRRTVVVSNCLATLGGPHPRLHSTPASVPGGSSVHTRPSCTSVYEGPGTRVTGLAREKGLLRRIPDGVFWFSPVHVLHP